MSNKICPVCGNLLPDKRAHNRIYCSEKRGYSLSDMATGKLPENFGQALTFIEIEQMIIEAAESAKNRIEGKVND